MPEENSLTNLESSICKKGSANQILFILHQTIVFSYRSTHHYS